MYSKRVDSCASRISKALAIRGMRPRDLVQASGIDRAAISRYLSGAYEPKQDRIYSIAKALDVSEAWLIGYDVPMEREKEISSDVRQLTEKEKQMLELFKLVPEDQQPLVFEMIRVALKTR